MRTIAKKAYLGAHMSIAGGVFNALLEGEAKGCDTIQIFVKSSNQWRAKPLSDDEVERYFAEKARTKIDPVVAHDSYLINLASPDKALLEKSRQAFLVEMQRCHTLQIPFLVTHPGSHLDAGEEAGIKLVAESLRWLFERAAGMAVKIALETTAGQGTNLGYRFEQLAMMMERSGYADRCLVCFDTCHAYAAGYDIATPSGYEKTWREFDRIIGFEKLACVHLNDSKKGLGSRVDRHEHIGKGVLGLDAFKMVMNDPRLASIPKILETPKGDQDEMDGINLSVLRRLIGKAQPKGTRKRR